MGLPSREFKNDFSIKVHSSKFLSREPESFHDKKKTYELVNCPQSEMLGKEKID